MKQIWRLTPLIGFGLATGIFVVASLASYQGSKGLQDSLASLARSQAVTQDLNLLNESLWGAQSAFRGYLLTSSPEMMEDYQRHVAASRGALERLRSAGSDQGGFAPNLAIVSRHFDSTFAFMNRCLALARAGRRTQYLDLVRTAEGKRLPERTAAAITSMVELETLQMAEWRRSLEASARGLAWILGLSLLSTAILMITASAAAIRENAKLNQAQAGLRESEDRVFQFLNALPVGVFVMAADGSPYFANKSGEQILGRGLFTEIRGEELPTAYKLRKAKTEEPYPASDLPAIRALAGERITATDIEVQRPDGTIAPLQVWGTPVFDSAARVRYSITAFADMTEHKALLAKLESLSRYDPLTSLFNRRAFMEEAELQLKIAAREGTARLIFFADVDNLKWINDNLGHQEGDRAIDDLARILRLGFRETDLIGRMGGDEFVVLARKNGSGNDAGNGQSFPDFFRERLDHVNKQPGRKYKLAFSFGHVEFDPHSPATLEDLIASADEQMYATKRAKAAGLHFNSAVQQLADTA
jgi:diguanylate cyclase (GGDEF)-like protein/PAS domain S-box-containing protein